MAVPTAAGSAVGEYAAATGRAWIWDGAKWVRAPGGAPAAASGGTENTYTGDGTNGQNGLGYKYHQFTADGSLVVTRAGLCSIALIGPGGTGGYNGYYGGWGGGGGQVLWLPDFWLPAATYSVIVGQPLSASTLQVTSKDHKRRVGTMTKFGTILFAMPGANGGGYADDGKGWYGANGSGGSEAGKGWIGYDGGAIGSNADNASGGGAGGAGSGTSVAPLTASPLLGGAGVTLYVTGSAVEYGKGGASYGNGDQTAAVTPSLPGHGGNASGQPGTGPGPRAGFRGEVIVRYVNA